MDEAAIRKVLDGIADYEEKTARTFELIAEHGAVATRATLGQWSKSTFHDLDDVPQDCPWQIGSRDPAQVVQSVFGGIAEQIGTFARALEEACIAVVAERTLEGAWRLLYYLQRDRPESMCVRFPGGSNRCTAYMGGAPVTEPAFNEKAAAAGWSDVPPQVMELAAVHDGFGPQGPEFGVESILPVAQMEPLNDDHPDWLELRCDSVGNRRLLLRDGAQDSLTVDWDHETGELAERICVFDWLNTQVSFELLDLDRFDFGDSPYRD